MKRLLMIITTVVILLNGTFAFAEATAGEANALRAAKSYLESIPFSHNGLISQLEYDGYTTTEAIYAVNNCHADWLEQALKSAKNYLSSIPFSYSGLIEQLEYDGYSSVEATYAADNCNADWKEQAVKCAKNYLEYSAFSRIGLIEQLEYEGFTHEQAVYGVEQNGYSDKSDESIINKSITSKNDVNSKIAYIRFPFSCDEGMNLFNALCQSLFDNGTLSVLYSIKESVASEIGNSYSIHRDGVFIDSGLFFNKEESTGEINCISISYSDTSKAVTTNDKTNLVIISMMFVDETLTFSDADALGVSVIKNDENIFIQNGFEYTYDRDHKWEIRKLNLSNNSNQTETVIKVDYNNECVDVIATKYLDGMGLPAETWCAVDVSRNYFVLCMIMDCLDVWSEKEATIAAEAMNYDTMYMVEDNEDISVWLFGKSDLMIFLYDTKANHAYYQVNAVDDAYTKAEKYMEALKIKGDIPSFIPIGSSDVMELIDSHS